VTSTPTSRTPAAPYAANSPAACCANGSMLPGFTGKIWSTATSGGPPASARAVRFLHLRSSLGPERGIGGRIAGAPKRVSRPFIVLVRAVTYAALFIGFVLVFLPAQALSAAGVARPGRFAAPQLAGMIVCAAGAAVAIWCVLSFALFGRGTPAPFDPPRRLVVCGPYRYLRNPMYLGAGLALAGAALFYETGVLWACAGGFLLLTHVLVVFYEEPMLRATFGDDYATYCRLAGAFVHSFSVVSFPLASRLPSPEGR